MPGLFAGLQYLNKASLSEREATDKYNIYYLSYYIFCCEGWINMI